MKRKITWILPVMVLILIAALSIMAVKESKDKRELRAEVADGLDVVRTYETITNVAAVEEEIQAYEDAQTEEESRLRAETDEHGEIIISARYTLAKAMVAGDSQAQALSAYEILNEASVAAKIGRHIKDCDEELSKIISMNPSIVFMTYGINDLGIYGKASEFADVYGEKLSQLRSSLPDAQIYVTAIFPANSDAIAKQSWLSPANLNAFNEALQKKTEELGMTFLNCNSLIKAEYYQQDGEHFSIDFYKIWAKYMADAAGF